MGSAELSEIDNERITVLDLDITKTNVPVERLILGGHGSRAGRLRRHGHRKDLSTSHSWTGQSFRIEVSLPKIARVTYVAAALRVIY